MSVGTRRTHSAAPRRAMTVRPAEPVQTTGAASLALRPALESQRRPARVLAAFPQGAYLEARGDVEPRVIALVTGEATRLPNSVVLSGPLPPLSVGDETGVGDGGIEAGGVSIRIRRWWDPVPSLGEVSPGALANGLARMTEICAASPRCTGLELGGFPEQLAGGAAAGSLLDTITATEQLMGLGPGLTPSGDDMLAGLLVALRHLGGACGADRAVWLADWLAATVAFDARTRTTPISATLLCCAADGHACAEALAVLRGLAGLQPLEIAVQRLLLLGHTSGADLAWGIRAGLSAVLALRKDG